MDSSLVFTSLPKIRIEKVRLQNVRGVNNGIVEFNCLKNPFEKDIQADILGLYGQNGSGKTTLLEALHVLHLLLCGSSIYSFDTIKSENADHARIEVSFQCINPDETLFHVEYSFSVGVDDVPRYITAEQYSIHKEFYNQTLEVIKDKDTGRYYDFGNGNIATYPDSDSFIEPILHENGQYYMGTRKRVTVFDEVLKLSGKFNGEDYRNGPIFDASSEEEVFLPKAKHTAIFPLDTDSTLKKLSEIKTRAKEDSTSFIFCKELADILIDQYNKGAVSPLGELICAIKLHAFQNIRILDSRLIDWASGSYSIEFFTPKDRVSVALNTLPTIMTKENLETLKNCLKGFNVILGQIIPGLSLEVSEEETQVDNVQFFARPPRTKESAWKVKVYSVRNNNRIPLAEESKGILHLITALGLFTFAFSNPCATVAIDEIDAGVYEYLLGELLLVFEEYGCGQLIFTCHNLRPLEVLNKKFVCFTTTNPDNRYIKPKSIRNENNLRDVYLREIITGGQEEELYSSVKHSKIAAALQKAGEAYE